MKVNFSRGRFLTIKKQCDRRSCARVGCRSKFRAFELVTLLESMWPVLHGGDNNNILSFWLQIDVSH